MWQNSPKNKSKKLIRSIHLNNCFPFIFQFFLCFLLHWQQNKFLQSRKLLKSLGFLKQKISKLYSYLKVYLLNLKRLEKTNRGRAHKTGENEKNSFSQSWFRACFLFYVLQKLWKWHFNSLTFYKNRKKRI